MAIEPTISRPYTYTELASGILQSRILKAIAIAAAAALVATALAYFFLPAAILAVIPHTIELISLATGGAIFTVAILAECIFHGRQLTFEFARAINLMKAKNWDQIGDYNILLGHLPNAISNDAYRLIHDEHIGAILSVNEPWERKPSVLSIPYTHKWEDLGVTYHEVDALDHLSLNLEQMHDSADFIHEELNQNKRVYVHCRAGIGRSATAIAAYLIKYQNMSLAEALITVKTSRPRVTVFKKIEALHSFAKECERLRQK